MSSGIQLAHCWLHALMISLLRLHALNFSSIMDLYCIFSFMLQTSVMWKYSVLVHKPFLGNWICYFWFSTSYFSL